MDREFYNSLSEAYAEVQEGRASGTERRAGQAAIRTQQEKERQARATGQGGNTVRQRPGGGISIRGGGFGRQGQTGSPPNNPPAAVEPKVEPKVDPAPQPQAQGGGLGAQPAPAGRTDPKPAVRQPGQGQDPKVSGYGPDGKPIRTSDVQARNTQTANKAAEIKRHGGDPTAGGEFKTKVTDTGSARLNNALTGIGKWNEELFHDLCDYLYEKNMARSYAHAADMLGEMSPEFIRDLTQEI